MSAKEESLKQIAHRHYELNGASTLDAALWFLTREKERHLNDIERINLDIEGLTRLGAKLPETPLDVFFTVPGVKY